LDCTFLGYDSAISGDFLPTFRDNLSVPSSGFRNILDSCWTALFWFMTQRLVEIFYRCFCTTHWSHHQGSRAPQGGSLEIRHTRRAHTSCTVTRTRPAITKAVNDAFTQLCSSCLPITRCVSVTQPANSLHRELTSSTLTRQ